MPQAVKYGVRSLPGFVDRFPFTASEVFHERGACFVTAAAADGNLETTAAADTAIFGWAMVGFSPEDVHVSGAIGSRIHTTSSDDGAEGQAMAANPCTVFLVPADAAFASSMRGDACDIVVTSNKQMADVGTSTTDVLRIVSGVVGVDEALVCVNKIQATT